MRFLSPYLSTLNRLFLSYSAFFFLRTIILQLSQYFVLFALLVNAVSQYAHLLMFLDFVSSLCNSLSIGNTAVLSHLQIICEYVIVCGHTHNSPSSSRMQLTLSKLQHSFRINLFICRLCFGVSIIFPSSFLIKITSFLLFVFIYKTFDKTAVQYMRYN